MSDNVVSHPHRDLMAEAKREREIADSAEGQVLQHLDCEITGQIIVLEQNAVLERLHCPAKALSKILISFCLP